LVPPVASVPSPGVHSETQCPLDNRNAAFIVLRTVVEVSSSGG
jgi:hypothetical protein